MKTRIAGAQIPVGSDIEVNKKEILKALDWAKENNVEHLLTPEGSLSGYCTDWKRKMPQLCEALNEVEDYQKKCGVALHLGTNFQEREGRGDIFKNQIRHYNNKGHLNGVTNKTFVLADEGVLGRNNDEEPMVSVPIYVNDSNLVLSPSTSQATPHAFAIGLICNDMWGANDLDKSALVLEVAGNHPEIQLIFHATNGRKFEDHDFRWDIFNDWHNSVLRLTSMFVYPILTVDSCTPWNWDGNEDTVDKCKTSSQSGVVDYTGWLTDVPRRGRQYFYHDLDVSSIYASRMDKFFKENNIEPFEYEINN